MGTAQYHVRVEKDYLVFSAGHFITLAGGTCERLHGHNYRVAAEIRGPLDENHCVVDFAVLVESLRAILGELDHRMLLPTQHPRIRVTADEKEVTASFEDRRWVFPRHDCALLPVANTTAELLAGYIACRLAAALEARAGTRPTLVRIEVDECEGQVGACELSGG
ncbi:MAG: 6-pyruvoyl tetrahydropterin synthase family protein [Thermoguttaceae bacterium]|jgi:6-pyruvoyltetrahydropterin/6-carboxytetrahydropterin synthase|nr:6-pyruvoyl tetrahydropterin synthase family protein [Thermoguttaceae bacterium]